MTLNDDSLWACLVCANVLNYNSKVMLYKMNVKVSGFGMTRLQIDY